MEKENDNKGLGILVGVIGGFLLGAYFFSKKDSKVKDKITNEINRVGGVFEGIKNENLDELEQIQGSIESILSNIESRIEGLKNGRKEN